MNTVVKYYKRRGAIGLVMRAYEDFEGKYRIDIKKAVKQYVATSRTHSDTKAGILETNRVFKDKDEANAFFIEMRDKENLIPAEREDYDNFSTD